MNYKDKNGNEIRAGMKLLMDDGSIEEVFATMDQDGNPISASMPAMRIFSNTMTQNENITHFQISLQQGSRSSLKRKK